MISYCQILQSFTHELEDRGLLHAFGMQWCVFVFVCGGGRLSEVMLLLFEGIEL
jgi:hypothetical protein